jgi:3'-phosphoadenosine 5'-phosphosulfate sulfotransferase (PAPS reductase)/FAD synthetase
MQRTQRRETSRHFRATGLGMDQHIGQKSDPMNEQKYRAVAMFSSGISSWAAAKRYAEEHSIDGMVLLFADTGIEDEDNYRFLHEAAANIGAPLEIIADGRTPWQVMRDEKIIGNSRIDPCSKILKRKLLDKWRNEHCDKGSHIILGICFDEEHRIRRIQERVGDWNYIAPLCNKPWLTKRDTLNWARSEGIEPPRMYEMGFPHANCGGFCIKGGQASFALLLKNFPDRYRYHEEQEAEMRKMVGDHSILKDRRGGKAKPLTLRTLRERIEANPTDHDEFDLGGCGCALPSGSEDADPIGAAQPIASKRGMI